MKFPSLKNLFINGFIFLFSLNLMLILAEFTLRWIDNYELFSLPLNRLNEPVQPAQNQDYTLDQFVEEFPFSSEVDPQWIYESPEPLPKFEILTEHQLRQDEYHYQANFVWNELFVERDYGHPDTPAGELFQYFPPEFYLFNPSYQTEFPRYRYPPNVTLPTGLTTNQFGWRGPQIELNKPENTIRIACVGASTTVSFHSAPFSYPELMQHWLNLWSQHNEYNINFEVINAGREGVNSSDIATIVRYELLPMEPDYIIYYEGSNQFNPASIVQYPQYVTFGQPPEGLAPNFANISSTDKSKLDNLAEYSALAQRIRSGVEDYTFDGTEPPKPKQIFYLPDGVAEINPDLTKVGESLNLTTILSDLSQIKQDANAHNAKLLLSTFNWFVYDGLVLDPVKHRGIFVYLNRVFWPISYANMRRAADFQNRVYEKWAAVNDVEVIDVWGQMPKEPDLYSDAIHNTNLGLRVRAWINFQSILPRLKHDIESGNLPRPDQEYLTEHPYIEPTYYAKIMSSGNTEPESRVVPTTVRFTNPAELIAILPNTITATTVDFYNQPFTQRFEDSLIITGNGQPAGVYFIYEVDPTQTYQISMAGQAAKSAINMRVRRDENDPEYTAAPNGSTQLHFSNVKRIEILLYADNAFSYRLDSIAIEACPLCETTTP